MSVNKSVWVVRSGRNGEFEEVALQGKVLVDFGLSQSIADYTDGDSFRKQFQAQLSASSASQLWRFAKEIEDGDMVVLPRKLPKPKVVAVGRVKGGYAFRPDLQVTASHVRKVEWLATDIPRTSFGQDLLYSFGGLATVFRVRANDAHARIERVVEASKKGTTAAEQTTDTEQPSDADATGEEVPASVLYEQIQDRIVTLIRQKFPGPALERLVASILEASGYDAQLTRPGPDSGIDIVAGKGDMGFGEPRLCIQVKSTSTPVGRPVYQQLQGAIQSFGADHGLLVSLGDFTSEVRRENERSFFSIRLWGPDELVNRFLETYDDLPPDIRTEIPLVDRKVLVESES